MLAEVYSETGRTELALALAGGWLDVSREQFGETAWTTAIAYAEYADTLLEAYRDEEAVSAFENSVTAFEANDGRIATDYTRAKLSRALLALGRIDEAGVAANRALNDARRRSTPPNSSVARVLVAYGEISVAEGDFGAAREAASEALAIFASINETDSSWYWLARMVIASAQHGEGDVESARSALNEIIAGLARDNGTRSRAEHTAQLILDGINTAP